MFNKINLGFLGYDSYDSDDSSDESSKQQILRDVIELVAKQLCLELKQVLPTSNFSNDLGADSLDMVELLMSLEENFGITIPEDEASTITTVQEAANYISDQLVS